MNNISSVRIQSSPARTINKQEAQKRTVQQKINETIENHKTAIVLSTLASIPTIFLATAIGRNPAKAAKYLKGNQNNFSNNAYKMGMDFVEKITKNEDIAKLLDIDLKKCFKDCPKDLLPKDGIFYHGTRNSSKIFKHGFTPYASNQLQTMLREFGAAIYLSPNEKVAQNFKLWGGKIIPVKLENVKIAIVDNEEYGKLVDKVVKFLNNKIFENCKDGSQNVNKSILSMYQNRIKNNAAGEILIQKIFTQAGYDGVYCQKGIIAGNGFLKGNKLFDINKMLGMEQTQLALFNSEKLTIQSRGFTDRLKDVGKGVAAQFRLNKNLTLACLDYYKSILKQVKSK